MSKCFKCLSFHSHTLYTVCISSATSKSLYLYVVFYYPFSSLLFSLSLFLFRSGKIQRVFTNDSNLVPETLYSDLNSPRGIVINPFSK